MAQEEFRGGKLEERFYNTVSSQDVNSGDKGETDSTPEAPKATSSADPLTDADIAEMMKPANKDTTHTRGRAKNLRKGESLEGREIKNNRKGKRRVHRY